jgi:hypothetical protein
MPVTYRALLARPGAPALLLVCGLSWLSYSGYGLAVILAVHAATGSFATAGAAAAVQAAGSALFAPFRGRLVDRHGPTGLRVLGTAHGVAAAVLVLALVVANTPLVLIGAALLGSSPPPLIGVARKRWSEVVGADLARTAHALNAALSDAAQIAGPPLAAGIAVVASPRLAVAPFAAGVVVAAFALAAALPVVTSPAHSDAAPDSRPRRDLLGILRENPGLRVLAVADLATGGWLAALDLAVIAIAGRHGHAAAGAFPLTASALGSIAMSLLAGSGRIHGAPGTRFLAGAALAAAVLPLTLLATGLAELAVVLVGVGAGFGLLNVAVYEALDHVVAEGRQVEAFTWLTVGSALGVALGSAASGRLAAGDAGPSGSLLLAVALALTALVVAALGWRSLRPATAS